MRKPARRRGPKKFTYGGRRIEQEDKIGFWENCIGTAVMVIAVGCVCVAYAFVAIGTIAAVLLGGAWVCSKVGLI